MPTDITLDGEGYMVVAGSYRRASDGAPDTRPGSISISDFAGGQRRAFQLERDRGWDAVGVGPALNGQGVEPWPFIQSFTDGVIGSVSTVRAPHIVLDPYAYLAVGRYLYRTVDLSASSWSAMTQVADAGTGKTITRLAHYQGEVALCCGNGLDVQLYSPGSGTVTTLSTGLKARLGIGYANRLIYADPSAGNEQILRMTTGGVGGDSRELDAPIVNLGLHDGKVAIATKQSLWLLGGRADPVTFAWSSEPQPFFTHGIWTDDEDFLFLLSYGGKLYTWLANGVMEWNPSGDRQGWRATGIEGRSCTGATVAGDRLIVTIVTRAGESESWAFDGTGWWLMLRSSNQTRVWPMYTGGAGNIDLVLFRDGSTSVTYDLVRLIYRHETATNYNTGASDYRTSLLDGNERSLEKVWRRIGAVFAAPELRGNPSSANPVTMTLSYSINSGRSWITAGSTTVSDPQQRTADIGFDLGATPMSSRFLQMRVSFSGVVDWSPALVGLWADYEAIGISPRRRRWNLSVRARDRTVTRDGAVDPRDGRSIAADLWQAWASTTSIAFEDVDFPASGTTYNVRIASIREEIPVPNDASQWGDSVVILELVEV
jgi:hypothetical protein